MGIHPTSKLDETEGFQCMGHSNWTICSSLSPFCCRQFSTFSLSYWEANSYYPRRLIMGKGNSSNFKIEWDKVFSVPGAFKLNHLQPIEPILFQNIFNFFTFILEGQFLLPQRANRGFSQFPNPNMDETEGFQCLGQSNWTICSPLSHFCFQIFPSFSLSYWEANSYYPRGPILGKGQFLNSKTGWDRGFSVPGAFKLGHLQPIQPILYWIFSTFFTFILGGHFLLPQTPRGPILGKRQFLNSKTG